MPDSSLRDWLALLATSMSALFAGLIYWIARKRLATRFTLQLTGRVTPNVIAIRVSVINRSDEIIRIERITTKAPFGLLVSKDGSHLGETARGTVLEIATPARSVEVAREIEPEKSYGWTMLLHHENGFRSCNKASIALHILKSFPVIRHKKKVLTAILPASTRNSAD